MTNNEFRHWLQGFFLLSPDDVVLNTQQLNIIRNHLNLVKAVEGNLDDVNTLFFKRILNIMNIDDNRAENVQARSLLTQELKIHLQSVMVD